MAKILLTGAAGSVGYETLKQLIAAGHEVTALDIKTRKNTRKLRRYKKLATIIYGDVLDKHLIANLVQDQTAIIHLAAIIPPQADHQHQLTHKVNFHGTKLIVDAIKVHNPSCFLIFTSSVSVYGDRTRNYWIRKTDPLTPSEGDYYAQTKIKTEQFIHDSGLASYTIFRLTAIMNRPQTDPLMFHMPLNTKLEIASVQDTVRALTAAIDHPKELNHNTYNLAGGQSCRTTYHEFLINMFKIYGLQIKYLKNVAFAAQNFHCGYFLDSDELENILHFRKDSLKSYYQRVDQETNKLARLIARIFSRPIIYFLTKKSEPLQAVKNQNAKLIKHYYGDKKPMKICIIGATGLLGYQAAEELIARGHKIIGLALPPVPDGLDIPKDLHLTLANFVTMPDSQLETILSGCDALVFAAGIDERVEGPPPIYNLYKKFNIDALDRVMSLAEKSGVKKTVVLGSYFSHFAKKSPRLRLAKHHPYIRSRLEQEKIAAKYAKRGMDVAVLELPYIFGAQKNRKPVWLFIAEMIKNTKGNLLFYPKGGTTMVTVRQVGEAIAGALEYTVGFRAYPVGWFNMTWENWLEQFSRDMGLPKKVVTIPTFLYKFAARSIMKNMRKKGIESGLEMVKFASLMTAKTYIDKSIIRDELGVTDDNIAQAIKESALASQHILDHPDTPTVDMKAE